MKRLIAYFFIVVGVVGFTRPAFAIDQVHDEIQVYNADITGVGQWTYEQHANYAAVGQTSQNFPADSPQIAAFRARRNLPMV